MYQNIMNILTETVSAVRIKALTGLIFGFQCRLWVFLWLFENIQKKQ